MEFTEREMHVIVAALRSASMTYEEYASALTEPRIKEQFKGQQKEADELREKIEQSEDY